MGTKTENYVLNKLIFMGKMATAEMRLPETELSFHLAKKNLMKIVEIAIFLDVEDELMEAINEKKDLRIGLSNIHTGEDNIVLFSESDFDKIKETIENHS